MLTWLSSFVGAVIGLTLIAALCALGVVFIAVALAALVTD
jgi:hypothetical protein